VTNLRIFSDSGVTNIVGFSYLVSGEWTWRKSSIADDSKSGGLSICGGIVIPGDVVVIIDNYAWNCDWYVDEEQAEA
jgi:hypothetical protein